MPYKIAVAMVAMLLGLAASPSRATDVNYLEISLLGYDAGLYGIALDVGKEGAWDGGTFMSFDILIRDGKFLFWYAAAPTGHGDETKMTIQVGHGTSR